MRKIAIYIYDETRKDVIEKTLNVYKSSGVSVIYESTRSDYQCQAAIQ